MVHIYRDLPTLGSVTVKICRENYNKKKKERSDTDIGTYDSPTHSLADVTVPTLFPLPSPSQTHRKDRDCCFITAEWTSPRAVVSYVHIIPCHAQTARALVFCPIFWEIVFLRDSLSDRTMHSVSQTDVFFNAVCVRVCVCVGTN